MNRQDQIFEYAFGEMSAQDAQVFEATLLNDIEAQKEINALKGLRNDFSLLSDIPEMQFSKERLRTAILDQGIQPKKRPGINWFQWLMAPTALAAVVALTFVVTRSGNFEDRSQITASNFGAGESPLVGTKSVEDPFSTPEASNPFSATVETTTPVKETIVAAKTTSEPRKRIRRPRSSSNQPLLVAATTPTLPGGAAFDMGTPHASAARAVAMKADAPGAAGAMFVADVPQDDRTIIVIDKEQESGVGAVVATEVSVSQDVIIGG